MCPCLVLAVAPRQKVPSSRILGQNSLPLRAITCFGATTRQKEDPGWVRKASEDVGGGDKWRWHVGASVALVHSIMDTKLFPNYRKYIIESSRFYCFTHLSTYADSSSTISRCPFRDANLEGVLPDLVRALTSAPYSSNNRATCVSPHFAAW